MTMARDSFLMSISGPSDCPHRDVVLAAVDLALRAGWWRWVLGGPDLPQGHDGSTFVELGQGPAGLVGQVRTSDIRCWR